MPGPTPFPPGADDADRPDELDFEPDVQPSTTDDGPPVRRYDCLRCDRPRPLERCYRLCRECAAVVLADPDERRLWLDADRGAPDGPTGVPAGSDEKVEVMRDRLLAPADLHHPADPRWEPTEAEMEAAREKLQALLSEPVRRPPGWTGVERDGTKYRARPMRQGKKTNLGEYAREGDAELAVWEFWREVLGLAADATPAEVEAARAADAERSRAEARGRREAADLEARRQEKTELWG